MKYTPLNANEKIEEYEIGVSQGTGQIIAVTDGILEPNAIVAINMDKLVEAPFNFNVREKVYAYARARNSLGWGNWSDKSRNGINVEIAPEAMPSPNV